MKTVLFCFVLIASLVYISNCSPLPGLFRLFGNYGGYGGYNGYSGYGYGGGRQGYGRSYGGGGQGGNTRYKSICRVHAIDSFAFPGRVGNPVCPY